jgi:hypothetical protein
VCWVMTLGVLVMVRQAHPFRLASDDVSYHSVAQDVSRQAAAALDSEGVWEAASGIVRALSFDLPVRANRSRPLVVWLWSLAYMIAGDPGVVWLWRAAFLGMLLALVFFVARLSSWPAAGMIVGALTVSPVTQGLLAWLSCAGYILVCLTLLLAAWLVVRSRSTGSAVGATLLAVAAVLSRESGYVLVPCFVALCAWRAGRRKLAAILVLLPVVLWFVLRPDPHAASADLRLAVRSAALVLAGVSASVTRNLGLLLLGVSLAFLWPFRTWLLVPLIPLSLVSDHFQLILPVLVLVASAGRNRHAVPGVAWTIAATGMVLPLGHFLSRYAFEPLVGLALAVAPGLAGVLRRSRALVLVPVMLWHSGVCLFPDVVGSSSVARTVSHWIDQRYRALELVTRVREGEWVTFGGRVGQDWTFVERAALVYGRTGTWVAPVWRAGPLWRGGVALGLHTPGVTHVVFDRDMIWQWTGWHWRPPAPEKPWGVHVELPGERWSVHPGTYPDSHSRCLWLVQRRVPASRGGFSQAAETWLERVPEVHDAVSVTAWLREVWGAENMSPGTLVPSTFVELELGRMLLRDDGWLDRTELTWLRSRRAPST